MAHLSLAVGHQAARNKTNALLAHLLWRVKKHGSERACSAGQMPAAKSIAIAAPKTRQANTTSHQSSVSFALFAQGDAASFSGVILVHAETRPVVGPVLPPQISSSPPDMSG
jgi:hypothetical protein